MKKKLLKILLGVVIVVALALVIGWLSINAIAKAAVERGGTYALGEDTRLDKASVSLLGGEVDLRGLTVANPEGYKTPHFVKVGRIDVAVRPGSLMGDTIEVNRFEIDDLDVYLEQKVGTSNASVILANASKVGGGKDTSAKPEAGKEPSGKKVKVDSIILRNVTAHVQVLPIGGQASMLTVKIPEITMKDVTSDNAGGVAVSELIRRLVPAILAAIVEKGKGIIPDADLKQLSGDIASATQAIGAGAANLAAQAGGEAAKLIEGAGDAAKGAGDSMKKGLEGIFGGKKKERSAGAEGR
jgi:hypothetical protein